jgi:hypothetical protein
MKNIFQEIYKKNTWKNNESVSGPGSTLHSTHVIRLHLPLLLKKYGIGSIFDAPCGDCNWISTIFSEIEFIDYIGGDIVPELIKLNNYKYSNTRRKFIQ